MVTSGSGMVVAVSMAVMVVVWCGLVCSGLVWCGVGLDLFWGGGFGLSGVIWFLFVFLLKRAQNQPKNHLAKGTPHEPPDP